MTNIDKRLENIDKKLDLVLESTFRQDERIKYHNKEIDEMNIKLEEVKSRMYKIIGSVTAGLGFVMVLIKFLI